MNLHSLLYDIKRGAGRSADEPSCSSGSQPDERFILFTLFPRVVGIRFGIEEVRFSGIAIWSEWGVSGVRLEHGNGRRTGRKSRVILIVSQHSFELFIKSERHCCRRGDVDEAHWKSFKESHDTFLFGNGDKSMPHPTIGSSNKVCCDIPSIKKQ